MSWISTIRSEVAELDLSKSSLRKFGLLVGAVFLLISGIGYWKSWTDAIWIICGLVGTPLVLLGAIAPALLKNVYRVWMTIAFAIGGVVSKILLTIIFFSTILPIGILGRLLGLPFAKIKSTPSQDSYWIEKPKKNGDSYEKLF